MVLDEKSVKKNPFDQFDLWFKDALKLDLKDPNAMNIATSTKSGKPSSRMVLLKDYSKKGFVFFTNYNGRKGKEIIANPHVALNIYWEPYERQVRIEGTAKKLSTAASNKYFASRPRLSQLGAHASNQSEVIENYEVLLDKIEYFKKKFKGKSIPRPKHWGGFRVTPATIEFWQGHKGRLHDRLKFSKNKNTWKFVRLSP